ncbi:hypothetical protein DYB28_002930 [Aphanomyces astaci]|uniref:SAC3/GANP/THP3 conserved domain-containing protein n=1 Tax=Aphanomyces astaci TaxID=112090 RepID=A0A9X8H2C4_APHAT|nr:hypothetical protein DYB28_002930 [Aphanomyces astaci]
MDDQPDNDVEKLDLSSAVTIDGLCVDMCSPKERDEQIRCDDLSTFEKGNPPEAFIIKRYQRSAADHKLDIPSEIRPLGVLRMTQLYLEQHVIDLDECGPDPRFNPPRVPDFLDLYNFFWNRARMIRNDFTLQNYRGGGRHHVIAMDVHERIARFFILCEHELIENPKFIEQQNMEQLGKSSPFEAEFAGYFILLHLDKASAVLKFTKRLPRSLLHSTFVQFAMAAFVARHTNDYVAFFRLVRQASLLQACLLHRYFPLARSDALGCMARVYRHPYPLEPLVRLLCFDSLQHAATVVGLHGLALSADGASVVFGTADFVADKVPVTCSDVYVRSKQGDWRRRDVCRGVTEYDPDKYPLLPRQIQETEMDERRRLYPTRPLYNDPFSKFTLEDAQPNSDIHQLRRVGTSSASLEAPPPPPVLAEPLSSAPPLPPPHDEDVAAKQKEADAAAIAAATRKAQEAAAAKEAKEAAAKEAAAKAAKEAADKEAAAEKQRVELERKEAAKRESERREALKAKYEIQALGQTWLRINFDSHDAVVARSNAMLKQEHDEVARAQRLAVQKLRFALWRKMVSRQQRPRVPGNAKFEPSTCGPHATASSVVQFQGPIESLLSNYYPKSTPPTAWTSTDKAITDASHAAMLALQHQLHKPVDVAGLLAPRLKRRYPRASSLAYSIAICRLPTDEDEDDKVSSSTSSTSTFDAAAWLAAKCGVSSGGHRVYTHESFALHLSSSVAPRSGPNTAVWFPVAFACLDQVGPWVRRLVNSSVLRGAPTAVHVVALRALHPHEVEATGQIELDRLASNWHLHWHVGPWDAAHAVVTSLAKSTGDTVTLIPVVPFTNVPLRDTIDDVVALTLHQTSLLSRPHISDLVRHVHHALSVLQRLFDASDSSSSDLMGQVLAAVPPSGTSGSTHGWIHSLPTLSATQRELAVHLVEAAWQLPHDQDEDASPAKSIVSIVYAIVLNGIEGLDAAVVALPTSWVVECRQLMHLVRTVSSIDKHARVLGKKRPPEDENVSTGALVSMMKKRSTTLTTAMTITPTTRHALQAKWKRDAARMRAMRALDHEKAAHAAFRRMLESAFET